MAKSEYAFLVIKYRRRTIRVPRQHFVREYGQRIIKPVRDDRDRIVYHDVDVPDGIEKITPVTIEAKNFKQAKKKIRREHGLLPFTAFRRIPVPTAKPTGKTLDVVD